MSSTILRQWMVLIMLPRPPRRIDTGSIEARLRDRGIEVHRRTIQRDLLELAEVFPIVADERAKPYGWRWADDAHGCVPPSGPRAKGGPRVSVSLRMAEGQLGRVLEAIGSAEYEVVASAELVVTIAVSVEDSRTTRQAIFGFGDDVEVLAPEEWREEMAERARRVLAKQARPTSPV